MEQKNEKPDYIKLHIPGESFWAIKLSDDTAEVANILLSDDYSLGDIVRFDKEREVVELLEKKNFTGGIKYPTEGDIKETFKKVYDYLESKDVKVEGAMAGMALIAFPVVMTDEELEKIVEECPIKIELMK